MKNRVKKDEWVESLVTKMDEARKTLPRKDVEAVDNETTPFYSKEIAEQCTVKKEDTANT